MPTTLEEALRKPENRFIQHNPCVALDIGFEAREKAYYDEFIDDLGKHPEHYLLSEGC